MNSLWLRIRPLLSNAVRYLHISYLEAKSEYQGTVLGVLWVPASTLIFTLLLATVFRHSETMEVQQFYLYVVAGYVSWMFISDTISGSTAIIQTRLDFAIHSNLSLAGLFAKTLADRIFEFGLNGVVLVASVALLTPAYLSLAALLIVPLIALLSITSLGLSYLVNLATIIFPDMAKVIRTGVRFMFFATPIFWDGTGAGDIRSVLEQYNPASHYLAVARQTFGIEPFNWVEWVSVGGGTVFVAVVAFIAFQQSHAFVRNLK